MTQLFAAGRAATAIEGPWMVGDLKSTVRYRVEPLPRIAAANGALMRPFLSVEGVFATPQGAARPAALAFARWLGRDVDAAIVRARVGHQVVAPSGLAWAKMGDGADPGAARVPSRGRASAVPMPTSTAHARDLGSARTRRS